MIYKNVSRSIATNCISFIKVIYLKLWFALCVYLEHSQTNSLKLYFHTVLGPMGYGR